MEILSGMQDLLNRLTDWREIRHDTEENHEVLNKLSADFRIVGDVLPNGSVIVETNEGVQYEKRIDGSFKRINDIGENV